MSLGMIAAWRAVQPKKERCERYGLYNNESLAKCSHCGDLNDRELNLLLEKKEEEFKGNARL